MYGVVLMAALTAGMDTPAWGHHGCHGCYGSCYGCYGCYGCGGCWGGYSCCGCWGGYSCYGCSGCWGCGGCYGYSGCYGCYGCYGGWSCCGCCGGYGVAFPSIYAPYPPPAAGPVMEGSPSRPAEQVPAPRKESSHSQLPTANTARLVVQAPEGTKLFVDDRPTATTSSRRVFRTPNLEPGQLYFYDLRAELNQNGKIYRQTRRVFVRAGEEVQASFSDLARTAGAVSVATATRP